MFQFRNKKQILTLLLGQLHKRAKASIRSTWLNVCMFFFVFKANNTVTDQC